MAEMDTIGGKRKFQENALTAKAETGTLKVKILRKDLASGPTTASSVLAANRLSQQQQQSQSHEPPRSPPKPRPNRKHVPIFYQIQTPSTTSSTDESVVAGVSQTLSTASDDLTHSHSTSESQQDATSSYARRFSSLLSGLNLESSSSGTSHAQDTNASSSSSALPRPPASNPLFTRNDSDGASSLFGDVLRHAFPSALGPAAPLGSFGASSAPPSLYASTGPAAATLASLSSAATTDLASSQPQSPPPYRFNPFTALQSAIDVHQATLSASSSHAPYQYPHERQHHSRPDAAMDEEPDASEPMADLGPPPSAPPAFTVQNSLMGGGIELQPVIANVNKHNFDWSSGTGRPRSGSLPNILESGLSTDSTEADGGSSTSASAVHMWKEV